MHASGITGHAAADAYKAAAVYSDVNFVDQHACYLMHDETRITFRAKCDAEVQLACPALPCPALPCPALTCAHPMWGRYQKCGQPVLIGGSMGTSSYVLVGTQGAMEQTFGSTCHGAGRAMSRAQSKKTLGYKEVFLPLPPESHKPPVQSWPQPHLPLSRSVCMWLLVRSLAAHCMYLVSGIMPWSSCKVPAACITAGSLK